MSLVITTYRLRKGIVMCQNLDFLILLEEQSGKAALM